MSIRQYITLQDDEGVNLQIPVDEEFAGVHITEIGMYVSTVKEDPEEDFWMDGDLYVVWDTAGLPTGYNSDTARVMDEFYARDGYTKRLAELLESAGFSSAAAQSVTTSESGMQDVGRASYDAYEIADEVRRELEVDK